MMRLLCLWVAVAVRGARAHGGAQAERKLRGGAFYLDGQFDGFESDTTARPPPLVPVGTLLYGETGY